MSLFNRFKLEFYQAFYWIFYFSMTLVKNAQLEEAYPWWLAMLSGLLVVGIVYTIVWIFSRVYVRPLHTALVLVITFLLYSLMYYALIYSLLPQWGYETHDENKEFTWLIFCFSMFLFFHHAMIEAGLLAAIYRVRSKERQKRQLLEKSHRTEVQFLTAQIDPHETANLLNIPYQLAVSAGNEAIATTLKKITQRLAYVPEKAGSVSSEVPLAEEMEQCGRILWLNNRRFEKCMVHIDVAEELHHWMVPVFSVSALLQNTFKYGVSWDEQAPISLEVKEEGNRLTIQLRNRINPNKTSGPSMGIGNGNIRQRLTLLYGGGASLETAATDDGWYESTLIINKA